MAFFCATRPKAAPAPRQQTRVAFTVAVSGAVIAALSACTGVQPQYNDAEADALVEDVLIEIMAEMDDPPAIEEERLVTDECEENWLYYESFYYYIFETGYLDDYKEELLDIWDELGYEFGDSETKRNGGPYLRAERSDGVYVTLTVCTLPSTEGKVILTARSGCVEM